MKENERSMVCALRAAVRARNRLRESLGLLLENLSTPAQEPDLADLEAGVSELAATVRFPDEVAQLDLDDVQNVLEKAEGYRRRREAATADETGS